MASRHPFPKQSADLLAGKETLTRDEAIFIIDRQCERLALEAAKWKSVAAQRLNQIHQLTNREYPEEQFPWGTLEDALCMRQRLTEEVAKLDGQLMRLQRDRDSDAWRNSAIGARATRLLEIRRLADWIDGERMRILAEEIRADRAKETQ